MEKPCEEEIEHVVEPEVGGGQQQGFPVANELGPGAEARLDCQPFPIGPDQRQFPLGHARMVSRIIPRIPPPQAEQSKSQGNEHIEGGAPAPVDCDHGHQRLGRGGAQGQSGTGYGIGQCPVTDRKPALYGRRLHRVHGRVGGPQYKAHQHQNRHDTGAGLDQRARQQAGQG